MRYFIISAVIHYVNGTHKYISYDLRHDRFPSHVSIHNHIIGNFAGLPDTYDAITITNILEMSENDYIDFINH